MYTRVSFTEGDDLGNILFGYVGKAFGFTDIALKGSAGAYQVYSGTSNYNLSSYFDDPRYQEMIKLGISLYK